MWTASAISCPGIAGTVPNMTASPGAAVVNLTGVAARTAAIYAGIFFIALAALPKLTSILLAIPSPVAAAYVIIIMGLVFVEGLKTITEDNLDNRKAVVVGVAFWIGLGFQNQAIFGHLISGTFDAVLSNSVYDRQHRRRADDCVRRADVRTA